MNRNVEHRAMKWLLAPLAVGWVSFAQAAEPTRDETVAAAKLFVNWI